MRARIQVIAGFFGRVGLAFLLFFIAWFFAPVGLLRVVLQLGWLAMGAVLAIRLMRMAARQAVWRLRNRLMVTYLFIAVVPLLLIMGLVALGSYVLVFQVAMSIAAAELETRIDAVGTAAEVIERSANRSEAMMRVLDPYFQARYAGVEALLRENGRAVRYPDSSALAPAGGSTAGTQGLTRLGDRYYIWGRREFDGGDIAVIVPVNRLLLDSLAPQLGLVDAAPSPGEITAGGVLPPSVNWFDMNIPAFAELPAPAWEDLGAAAPPMYLVVLTRPSAVLATVFEYEAATQGLVGFLLAAGLIVFVLVEIICWVIGVSMTRTITGAVHHLYEGTERVMRGEFTHRIEASGNDQLGQLGVSFNRMTENVQRLLEVAKEKERLQSGIEIAREVQSLLYPRTAAETKTLRVTAVCHPARLVSGDYYDYEMVRDRQMALAIGDVAGKGVSAALLMATVQSALRTQLLSSAEALAASASGGSSAGDSSWLSTSWLVGRLNRHLCANTSAEKYATFWLGLYDEPSSSFVYTNAGHLPPVLVRRGNAQRLDVNGTVVGAFPFAQYDESRVALEPGDLLVCFTDGITEPENAFGEMFGEERLVDMLAMHAEKDDRRIIEIVMESVREWTGSDELQDDMTLLLARRV